MDDRLGMELKSIVEQIQVKYAVPGSIHFITNCLFERRALWDRGNEKFLVQFSLWMASRAQNELAFSLISCSIVPSTKKKYI